MAGVTEQTDLEGLLSTLRPELRPGNAVYCTTDRALEPEVEALATITESEGITYVLQQADADRLEIPYEFVGAWITLRVHSALDAVGLTAAVSTALASAGIACNVLAGYFHDHLIVPAERAADALEVLTGLAGKMTA